MEGGGSVCEGCIIFNNVKCCYNCLNVVMNENEARCIEYSGIIKEDNLFKEINCPRFKMLNRTSKMAKEIEINYCPVCGKKVSKGALYE